MNFSPTPPPRSAAPVPGRPGLFRLGGTVFYQPHRYREYAGRLWHRVGSSDESPTLVPVHELDSAKRTAMSGLGDFSVPPPPTSPYTWDVPRSQPWTIGDLPSLRAQWTANANRYDTLKRAIDPMLVRYPFSASRYTEIATRVVATPHQTIVRLTLEQFALLSRAMLSTVSTSQNLAAALLSSPRAGDEARARKLLFAAKDTIDSYTSLLTGVQRAQGAARWVGLGAAGVDDAAVIIAGIIAATIVVLVGAGLVYLFISTAQANAVANAEAERVCALSAARGEPCGGAEFQAALERAREGQRTFGGVPNLDRLFQQAGSLLFWGGLLVIGAGLAYAAYTAEPARRQLTARFSGARAAPTSCDSCQRAKRR